MNEIAKLAPSQDEVVRVLQSSLYPGASRPSIELVLSWCRVNNIDPMLRPVHIVPQRVKNARGDYEWRDTLMPGIALYRILAARSGEYAGKSEPEFGPDVTETLDGVRITYPQWCRVTVQRIIAGKARTFAAREYWLENYGTAKRDSDAPNAMWRKRAYGQLAKCAEAQALRQAFPEFSGGAPSAEEMEGKTGDWNGPTIEAEPARAQPAPEPQPEPEAPRYLFATNKGGAAYRTSAEWLERWRRLIEACKLTDALDKLQLAKEMNETHITDVVAFDSAAASEVMDMLAAALPKPTPTQTPIAAREPEDDAEMALP